MSFTIASISDIVNKNNTTETTIDKPTNDKPTNDKKEKECSYDYDTPDRYENLPPTTSQILFDECYR